MNETRFASYSESSFMGNQLEAPISVNWRSGRTWIVSSEFYKDDKFPRKAKRKKDEHEWNNKRPICWCLFLSSCLTQASVLFQPAMIFLAHSSTVSDQPHRWSIHQDLWFLFYGFCWLKIYDRYMKRARRCSERTSAVNEIVILLGFASDGEDTMNSISRLWWMIGCNIICRKASADLHTIGFYGHGRLGLGSRPKRGPGSGTCLAVTN